MLPASEVQSPALQGGTNRTLPSAIVDCEKKAVTVWSFGWPTIPSEEALNFSKKNASGLAVFWSSRLVSSRLVDKTRRHLLVWYPASHPLVEPRKPCTWLSEGLQGSITV